MAPDPRAARFVQGIMLGGEWAGAVLLAVEPRLPEAARPLMASMDPMRYAGAARS